MTTTKEKYNEWKALQFLKEYGEYENYIEKRKVILTKGLTYIPKKICYLKELKKLILDYNRIDHIPKEISYLKELEILSLDCNRIDHIPKEICYLKNLIALHLDYNRIDHIPKEISYLKDNLETIWIQNNPLIQIKEDIQKILPKTEIWK